MYGIRDGFSSFHADCVRAAGKAYRVRESVCDAGTGSGIAAIATARLGAQRVLGFDNDPEAGQSRTSKL